MPKALSRRWHRGCFGEGDGSPTRLRRSAPCALPTEETMRWTLLLIAPALLAGCTQLGDQYDLGNSDSPGGTHGCKVGFSKVWTGQSFEYLCNDGPDVVDIVVPPTV